MNVQIGPREVVHENPFHRIDRVAVNLDGVQKEYFVNSYGRKIGVLISDREKILLVRQYRFLVNGLAWEIPGGKIEISETAEAAAIREVIEETGIQCESLRPLVYTLPGLDNFENPTSIFYTEKFRKIADLPPDLKEVVERTWIPLQRALEMVFNGEIVDSMTIIAILGYNTVRDRGDSL